MIYKKQYKNNICGGMTKSEQSSQEHLTTRNNDVNRR